MPVFRTITLPQTARTVRSAIGHANSRPGRRTMRFAGPSLRRVAMRWSTKALGAAVLLAGFGFDTARALPPAPKADEMARVMPEQAGVDVTTPAAAQLGQCRVEPFPNSQAPVGYVLLDGANKPVRRFVAVNAANFNIVSFYLDGEEV